MSAQAYHEYVTTAREIDEHEMRNFGGAYGFCPQPELEIIHHSQTVNAKRDAALKQALEALMEIYSPTGFSNLKIGPGSIHERINAAIASIKEALQ